MHTCKPLPPARRSRLLLCAGLLLSALAGTAGAEPQTPYERAVRAADDQSAGAAMARARAGDGTAVQDLSSMASTGNATATAWLGCLRAREGDAAAAYSLFGRAAELGNAAAQFNQAVMLQQGRGGQGADPARAYELAAAAWNGGGLAEAGAWLLEDALRESGTEGTASALASALESSDSPVVQAALARMAFAQGRHAQALPRARSAAAAGDAGSAELLAVLYRNGLGVDRDLAEAAAWSAIADAIRGRAPVAVSPDQPGDATARTQATAPFVARQADQWMRQHRSAGINGLACGGETPLPMPQPRLLAAWIAMQPAPAAAYGGAMAVTCLPPAAERYPSGRAAAAAVARAAPPATATATATTTTTNTAMAAAGPARGALQAPLPEAAIAVLRTNTAATATAARPAVPASRSASAASAPLIRQPPLPPWQAPAAPGRYRLLQLTAYQPGAPAGQAPSTPSATSAASSTPLSSGGPSH